MEGYEIPEIIIKGREESIRWQKVVVGVSRNRVSANGRYQMILHPDLLNEAIRKNLRHMEPETMRLQEGK